MEVVPVKATIDALMFNAVVFDLDGVLRTFDSDRLASIEAERGLDPGILWRTAFAPDLISLLVTGVITRAEWSRRVGAAVGSPEAAAEWQADIGTVQPDVVAVVDEVRATGRTTAILTNGTDTIPAELAELGLDDHVDRVFNSAEIGVAKPDPRIFEHVCAELALAPQQVFFTDDSAGHVEGARAVGLVAYHYQGVDGLRAALAPILDG